LHFSFGEYNTSVHISQEIPCIETISDDLCDLNNALVICDENTASIAGKICGGQKLPLCVLKSGEENKNWISVNVILEAAQKAGLGRDCVFIAVGGGVIGDLAGFAASIYMRGCGFILVSTTLLGMVDASVGGKTGFDLFGIKNLAGTFYPAQKVFMPLDALSTLPKREWKSGMAELIKTVILAGEDFLEDDLKLNIEKSVLFKGGIVSEDPFEKGKKRILLNLGHTFGHALESAAGLGKISHGEAVAWGIVQACSLGFALGITPLTRAKKIKELIKSNGYDCESPHPSLSSADLDADVLIKLMQSDKKKKKGNLTFIVPDKKSAIPVILKNEDELSLLKNILKGTNAL